MAATSPIGSAPLAAPHGHAARQPVPGWLVGACWLTWLIGPAGLVLLQLLPTPKDEFGWFGWIGFVAPFGLIHLQFLAFAFVIALATTAAVRLVELWLLVLYVAVLVTALLAMFVWPPITLDSRSSAWLRGAQFTADAVAVAFPLLGARQWMRHSRRHGP